MSANLGESYGCDRYLEKRGRCVSAIWRKRKITLEIPRSSVWVSYQEVR